jgi:hypothetical protein
VAIEGALKQLGESARFRIVRKLGEGGMGAVYEAEDRERGQRVAIKTLVRGDAVGLMRFKHEFRALQDLEHPNLVRLGELHEADGEWFLTMELVPGTDLLTYVQEGARGLPYDEARLRAVFQQLAVGLRALHVAGKVHRDIKPSNVRVTPEGRVVILDFGLVIDRSTARMSTDGNIVGTVAYMAPEQASASSIEPSADWYAFGVVLYEAMTGTVPFSGDHLQVLMSKLSVTPPPARARVPGVPADLDELCVELLRMDPGARPHGDEVLRRLGATSGPVQTTATRTVSLGESTPFVGRSSEFSALDEAFAELCNGRTLTVSVEGPSGIGKSALVGRFVQEVAASGREVMLLSGRCYERETARFKALDALVDALATALSRLPKPERHELVPRNAALLRQLFPVLGRVDAIARAPRATASPGDPVEERRWMFASLRELLARLGERKLVVLVIDDMHWADGDSLELLRSLLDARHEPPPRLLLLTTARVPWLDVGRHGVAPEPWPSELRTLQLETLADDDALALASLLLARLQKPEMDARQIVREAGGHPLFVAELARHAETAGAGSESLTLDDAIWERALALPEPALRALKLLAVASVPLPSHILELSTQLAPDAFERQLGLLRLGGFVRTATGRDPRRVEPYHDRVREAVLDRLGADEAVELHGALAPLLEQEPGIAAEHVARHYFDAGERDKAAALFERAARSAEEGFAFERAAQLYRLQLELRVLGPAERSAIHRQIGAALARAGLGRAAADAYAQAIEGADELSRVQLRYLSASHLLRSGYLAEGLEQLDQVLEGEGLSAPKSRFGALASLLWEHARTSLLGYRVAYRDVAAIAPKMLARVDALAAVAQGLAWIDGVRAAPVYKRGLRVALAAGERGRISFAMAGEAVMLSLGGVRNRRAVENVLALAREAAGGVDPARAQVHGALALVESSVACNLCDFRRSFKKANEAIALLEQQPAAEAYWERSSARVYRLFGHLYLGRMRAVNEESSAFLADAEARRDRWLAGILRCSTSFVRFKLGMVDPEGSGLELDEAFAPWRTREPGFLHANWVLTHMGLSLYARRGDQALARLQEERSALRRSGTLHVEILRAWFSYYAANALLLAYQQSADRTALRRALVQASTIGSGTAWYAGLSALIRAQVALAQHQPEQALGLAREAEQRLEEAGAVGYAMGARWLRGTILGGEEGRDLVAAAGRFYAEQTLPHPEVFMRSVAPFCVEPPR